MTKSTAEARRRGETQEPTTEARRHGEDRGASDAGLYQGTGVSRALKEEKTWAVASENFKKIMRTMLAALREIFDESAYDRFLLRTQASRSTASYREFTRERDAAMLKKPRCC